jgi:hypothetical protein
LAIVSANKAMRPKTELSPPTLVVRASSMRR